MIWTKEEEDFLKINFPIQGAEWCGLKLNRTKGSIYIKCTRLGLKQLPEVTKRIYEEGLKKVGNSLLKCRVGMKNINGQGCRMEVIEYINCKNLTVKFIDYESIRYNISLIHFNSGEVKNFLFPELYGVGYLGEGVYKAWSEGAKLYVYSLWKSMLKRVYDDKASQYKDVTVCEEWHNFQNFAEWFENNYVEGWQLDKDILSGEYKMYSPKTCCFVPKEINSLIITNSFKSKTKPGVRKDGNLYKSVIHRNGKTETVGYFNTEEEAHQYYKKVKKEYIKEIADKYKDKLDQKVYDILIDFDVDKIINKRLV